MQYTPNGTSFYVVARMLVPGRVLEDNQLKVHVPQLGFREHCRSPELVHLPQEECFEKEGSTRERGTLRGCESLSARFVWELVRLSGSQWMR